MKKWNIRVQYFAFCVGHVHNLHDVFHKNNLRNYYYEYITNKEIRVRNCLVKNNDLIYSSIATNTKSQRPVASSSSTCGMWSAYSDVVKSRWNVIFESFGRVSRRIWRDAFTRLLFREFRFYCSARWSRRKWTPRSGPPTLPPDDGGDKRKIDDGGLRRLLVRWGAADFRIRARKII